MTARHSIQTASGIFWPLTDPTPDQVHWADIGESLAKLCRFNGHLPMFYSVAQHSVLVADILPLDLRLHGLLHDAHEAFIGDITTPCKEALRDLGAAPALERLAAVADRAIFTAAGLDYPVAPDILSQIKIADHRVFATEDRDLRGTPPRAGKFRPCRRRITPWPWPKAMEVFIERLERHLPMAVKRSA